MEKYRKVAGWLLAAVCILMLLLSAAACLDIRLGGEGFSRESIARRFSVIAPVLGVCLGVGLISLPAALRGQKKDGDAKRSASLYRRGRAFPASAPVRRILLGAGALFILLGVINGGARDVLIKAVSICTECIGLG